MLNGYQVLWLGRARVCLSYLTNENNYLHKEHKLAVEVLTKVLILLHQCVIPSLKE